MPLHVQVVAPMLFLSKYVHVFFVSYIKVESSQKQNIFKEIMGLNSENDSTNRPNRYKVSIVSVHTFFFSSPLKKY